MRVRIPGTISRFGARDSAYNHLLSNTEGGTDIAAATLYPIVLSQPEPNDGEERLGENYFLSFLRGI